MSSGENHTLVDGLIEGRISRRLFIQRATALGMSVSSIGAILAACGGDGGDGGAVDGGADAPPPVGPGTPTPAPPPTPVVAAIGKGSDKLVFWHGLGGADGATLQVMLRKFAAEKTNLSVQSETYGWDVFYQKLPTSIIAKTPPDVAIMHEWAIQQFASQGILANADDWFFSDSKVQKDDFNKGLMEKISPDRKPQGVPFDNHGWGMFYNTKLIKDAGLDPEKLPANGDEWIDWCIKLTTDANGKHPDEDGFNVKKVKIWATGPSWPRPTILSTMWQYGGGVFEGKKSMLDSENSVKGLQYWVDLIHKHRVSPVPSGNPWVGEFYENNKLALMWEGSWSLNFFKDRPKLAEVTKAAPLPSLGGEKAAWMSSHMLVMPNGVSDEGQKRAKEFVSWLLDHNGEWAASGQVPARISVQESADIANQWSVGVFAKQFQEFGRTEPPHTSITEIQAKYEPAFDSALNKLTPAKDALTKASKEIQAILDRS